MTLELYHRQTCPFSVRVRNFISSRDLRAHITYHDLDADVGAAEKLRSLAKEDQVPCLIIDGKPLFESVQIISWLGDHAREIRSQKKAA